MKKVYTESLVNELVKRYVDPTKSGQLTFNVTRNNIANLIDTIGKIITIDGEYDDKLSMLNGEDMPLGKTIEEYFQDLILADDYDKEGTDVLKRKPGTFAPTSFSYTLGRLKLKESIPYDDYERACTSLNDYATITSMLTKRLSDSEKQLNYKIKKQGLGNIIAKIKEAANPAKTYSSTAAYEAGEFVKKDSGATAVGVIINKLEASEHGAWDAAVAAGNIVTLDLLKTLAKPVDTATGEAFIKQIKTDVENASFVNEHNSFNGRSIGASKGLYLFLKRGIVPSLEVDTLAGAFHDEKLAMDCKIIVVDDFGADEEDVYAILMDTRMCRLHNTYRATREDFNGEGDFANFIRHTENTFFYSRNTYVRAYKGK